jgi:hypothetical protein
VSNSDVLGVRLEKPKVALTIIGSISVPVMDAFSRSKWPAELLLHHQSMLHHESLPVPYPTIALRSDPSDSATGIPLRQAVEADQATSV